MRDYFVSGNAWYWIIQVISPIYYLSTIAYMILLLNVVIIDTYCEVYPCGAYFTLRFHSLQWIAVSLTGMRFLAFPLFAFAVVWRKDLGCTIFWFILFLIVVMLDVFAFLSLSRFYASCNGLNQPYNLCNDVNYCCAAEIWSVSSNRCKNTGPCPVGFPTILSQLAPNDIFIWIWSVCFPYVLVEILALSFLATQNFALANDSAKKRIAANKMKKDE